MINGKDTTSEEPPKDPKAPHLPPGTDPGDPLPNRHPPTILPEPQPDMPEVDPAIAPERDPLNPESDPRRQPQRDPHPYATQ